MLLKTVMATDILKCYYKGMHACTWICLTTDASSNVTVCVSKDTYVIINYCKLLCQKQTYVALNYNILLK